MGRGRADPRRPRRLTPTAPSGFARRLRETRWGLARSANLAQKRLSFFGARLRRGAHAARISASFPLTLLSILRAQNWVRLGGPGTCFAFSRFTPLPSFLPPQRSSCARVEGRRLEAFPVEPATSALCLRGFSRCRRLSWSLQNPAPRSFTPRLYPRADPIRGKGQPLCVCSEAPAFWGGGILDLKLSATSSGLSLACIYLLSALFSKPRARIEKLAP